MKAAARPERLMVLGGSLYNIPAIRTLKSSNRQIIVVDRSPEAPGFAEADTPLCLDFSDQELTLKAARELNINGILPFNDYGVVTAAYVAEALGLSGISCKTAQNTTNKLKMRQIWDKAGLPSVRYRHVNSLEEAEEAVKSLNTWPLIFKPADSRGGGSRGVSVVSGPDEVEHAMKFAQNYYTCPSVLIEECLQGSEHSLELLISQDQAIVFACSDKVKTPWPYCVDKSVIYPTALKPDEYREVAELAKRAVKELGIDIGAAHVEICMTADGPRLFEVGARLGGGGTPEPILSHVTGHPVMQLWAEILLGGQLPSLQLNPPKGCIYDFIIAEPGVVESISGLKALENMPNILDFGLTIKEGDTVCLVRTGLDRSGFIISAAETRAEALSFAQKAQNILRITTRN